MKVGLAAFAAGVIFALGLGISGMTQPSKVIGFLDLAGRWDPSLALVMVGAIAVHAAAVRLIRRRPRPLLGERFDVPSRADVDARLLAGAAVFGIGWGLAGYCPGPAVTSTVSGLAAPLIFTASMLAGMLAFDAFDAAAKGSREASPAPTRAPGSPAATDG